MSRENVLILLGVLVALSPYSGLPLWLLGILLPLLGLSIIASGVLARRAAKRSGRVPAHAGAAPVPTYEASNA